ncbi:MAG: NADH-quinone oxidoreductase subunit N [Phycisphaerae bacterium]|jgi:NADH-quinone oxidoreductase subunit N|nr:NADH-quinone oxidoreductase subunit N [Phycisphaerae bacterium]
MINQLTLILPEILLIVGAVVVTVLGVARSKVWRDAVPTVTVILLLASCFLVHVVSTEDRLSQAPLIMPGLGLYAKTLLLVGAAALVLLGFGLIDRKLEMAFASGRAAFDPIRVMRGEYHSFLLLSVAGACLLCNAPDLIWLFLAIELVSLPTYIMVATSRAARRAQEAAVKYFFLGAMSSAILLYGFALLYGATGTLQLSGIREAFAMQAAQGGVGTLGIIGLTMVILGLCYKISAAPMHIYAPDVYEGAATPLTAFLAFVPKAAGFLALILLLSTASYTLNAANEMVAARLPQPIMALLWMVSVLTMTLGNIGALLQKSLKRMLAYSSIAHSGYMLIGLIAGPAIVDGFGGSNAGGSALSGTNAALFYLLSYAIMNIATFGPLASLERNGEEIETLDDIAGLRQRHPGMAASLAIGAASLIGLPPLLGFWAKLYLFAAGIERGQTILVIIAAVNSGVSVYYYLKLLSEPLVAATNARSETISASPSMWPRMASIVTAIMLVVAPLFLTKALDAANAASAADARTAVRVAPTTDTLGVSGDDQPSAPEVKVGLGN